MYGLRTLHLFAGAGGGILADMLLGHRPVCAVERSVYCQQVLHARQTEGCLPWFPIFDDVCDFDGTQWCGLADVVSGGFPCQDISTAGKGAGITGARSGLWGQMARIVGEVRPRYVFVENSSMLVKRGLEKVLGDLADLGYDARWCVLGASDVGAPHVRKRFWLLAYSQGERDRGNVRCVETPQPAPRGGCSTIPDTGCCGSGNGSPSVCQGAEVRATAEGSGRIVSGVGNKSKRDYEPVKRPGLAASCGSSQVGKPESTVYACGGQWWGTEPPVCGVADGVAAELDIHAAVAARYMGRVAAKLPSTEARIMALGNGQVPLCAATAWRILSGEFD